MLQATIASLKNAFKEIKHNCIDVWEGDYRLAGRMALKEILENRMHNAIDQHLEYFRGLKVSDRRNGGYRRHLLTEMGKLELEIPRTRHYNPVEILNRYARRTANIDRMIQMSFILGLSTQKVSEALLPVLGEPVSRETVSRIAQQLDGAVAAYHKRPLVDQYEVMLLDGVVIKRKTGSGAQKRVILVALGIRPGGKKEIIDFTQAQGESQLAWEGFLHQLYERGIIGQNLKLMITDGGPGLHAALSLVYGQIPLQRCWAHKTRNVLNHVKDKDHASVKKSLHQITHAPNLFSARQGAKAFKQKWEDPYPNAVKCLLKDLDHLLTFLTIKVNLKPSEIRTTNAIERRFVEVRRRTRPMGTFNNHNSVERILFAIFIHENKKEGTTTPFLLTQKT